MPERANGFEKWLPEGILTRMTYPDPISNKLPSLKNSSRGLKRKTSGCVRCVILDGSAEWRKWRLGARFPRKSPSAFMRRPLALHAPLSPLSPLPVPCARGEKIGNTQQWRISSKRAATECAEGLFGNAFDAPLAPLVTIQTERPWKIIGVATGPDQQPYAMFSEDTTGWPLSQCERADEGVNE